MFGFADQHAAQPAQTMKKSWFDHRSDLALALALFVASCVFFALIAKLSAVEYGAQDASLSGSCRWDCGWYSTIVRNGYHLEPSEHPKGDAANWAFFPAFPLSAKLVSALSGFSPGVALVVTSKLFLFGSILAFLIAAGKEYGPDARLPAAVLVAFNPYVVYGHAGYAEPLYFLLTTLAFLAVGSQRWVVAGIAAGALSATRLVGGFFGVVLLVEYLRTGAIANRRAWPALALALMLCPLGLAAYMAYLYVHVGDALAFKHVQVAWGREISNPFGNLIRGLRQGGWNTYFAGSALAAFAVCAWLAWRRHFGHAIFLAAVVLIPLSTGLTSLPRYIFWQFPFLFGLLGFLLAHRALKYLYLAFSSAMSAVLILAWFTGRSFVW